VVGPRVVLRLQRIAVLPRLKVMLPVGAGLALLTEDGLGEGLAVQPQSEMEV